jgi:hypothetical protein
MEIFNVIVTYIMASRAVRSHYAKLATAAMGVADLVLDGLEVVGRHTAQLLGTLSH